MNAPPPKDLEFVLRVWNHASGHPRVAPLLRERLEYATFRYGPNAVVQAVHKAGGDFRWKVIRRHLPQEGAGD